MAEKTVKELKNQLKRKPDDTEALEELVGILRLGGKYDQAISLLERYLSSHPDDYAMMITYGEILLDVGGFEEAIAMFRRVCDGRPSAEGHYLIVNKNLIEMIALFMIATSRIGRWGGLDAYISAWRSKKTQSAIHAAPTNQSASS